MSNNSLETLLEWMNGRNRTLGWDAVMALDQRKTNMLLSQEYINHFDNDSYLPPVTASIETSETITQYVYGFTLGVPLLAFTNANLEDSKAALTMDVVGGSHVTVEQVSSRIRRVRRFSEVVPLAGPKLTLELNLLAVPGSVNQAGQVVLDLKQSSNFKLDFVDNATEQALGGAYFKQLFEGLPDDKRVFVLGELKRDTGGAMVPESFSLRTQPAPGAKAKGAANYGDGAVLVFITMPGGRAGSFPANGSDWMYLIPAAQGGVDYSGTLLLSNRAVMEKSLRTSLATVFPDTDFDTFSANGELKGLKATSQDSYTKVLMRDDYWPYGDFQFFMRSPDYPLHEQSGHYWSNAYTLTNENDRFVVRWSGFMHITVQGLHSGTSRNLSMGHLFNFEAPYGYELNDGNVKLRRLGEGETRLSFDALGWQPPFNNVAGGYEAYCTLMLGREFYNHSSRLQLPAIELETFLLSSLLFRGNNSLHVRDVRHPHDLALFGEVDPSQTAFAITPVRPIIGHGSRQTFTTVPPRTGLTWRAQTVPGDDSAPGDFDAGPGLYRAPAASAIKGSFTRVIVTATDPADGTTSSAMVTVMVRDIVIDPLIQICGPRQHRELSAGALGEDTLRWRLVGDTGGATLLPSTENDGDYTFTAGSQAPDGTGFFLNTIEVESVTTGKTQQAHVLVLHGDHTLSVEIDKQASLPAGQFKMVAKRNGTVRPTARFALTAGSGAITPEGIYTVDPNGTHRFALITAVYELRDEDYVERFEGYNIFPLPLEEFSSIWPDRSRRN